MIHIHLIGHMKLFFNPSKLAYTINLWLYGDKHDEAYIHSLSLLASEWETIINKSKTEPVEIGIIKDNDGYEHDFYLKSNGAVISYTRCWGIRLNDTKMEWRKVINQNLWKSAKETMKLCGMISPPDFFIDCPIEPIKWKEIKIASARTPVKFFNSSYPEYDVEYFFYLFEKSIYISEIDISPEDVLTIIDFQNKNKKEKLTKELKRILARAEATGLSREPIPENVQIIVWNRDQGKCAKCGSSVNLEFDHLIPISKGGSDTARNIQLLCEKCNRSKRDNLVAQLVLLELSNFAIVTEKVNPFLHTREKLPAGSIIPPGRWGMNVTMEGKSHPFFFREHMLEIWRRYHTSVKVSRFNCCYAFEDDTQARMYATKDEFVLTVIPLNDKGNKARLDMLWVTWMGEPNSTSDKIIFCCENYWKGLATSDFNHKANTTWEWLFECPLKVIG